MQRGSFICVVVQPSSGLSSLVPHRCRRGGRTRRVPCRRLGVRRQTRLKGREVCRQRRAERDSQLPSRRVAVTSTARRHRTRCGLQPRHRQSRLLCRPCCGWCHRRRPTIVGERERVREGESRRRRTVAELSLPPRPAAVESLAVAHGVTPVSFCRRKMPLLPSPENSAAAIIKNLGRRRHSRIIGGAAAGLPPNRFGDHRCFGSAIPSVRVVVVAEKMVWS
nr:uncharacterized protein LOC112721469 [Arachis hypogaea]XP_025628317.1 uncharacterized protein LOC112721470 [Arachis hypogaea]